MTTQTQIKETITEVYEPTVQDKIQRIIYRLEHGEQLCGTVLRNGDNFCVLGLFADESGLGRWIDAYTGVYEYCINDQSLLTILNNREILDYYDFDLPYGAQNSSVSFILNEVNTDLANKIRCLFHDELKYMVDDYEIIDLYRH